METPDVESVGALALPLESAGARESAGRVASGAAGRVGAGAPAGSWGARAAEAFAVADVAENPGGAGVTAPAAVRFRRSVAWVMWLAIVRARETPIAADLPCASPSAVVFADAVWSADAENAPPMVRGSPGVTCAIVVMFEIAIATDGTIATLPPAAPVFACVVMRCVVDAETPRSPPPVSFPVSSARVVLSTSATATEAPMPTDPTPDTPDPLGSASVVDSAFAAAVIATSPLPASSGAAMRAVVWMFSRSIATEPAMPTAPPPAPLVADAPRDDIPSPVTSASTVAPCALTVASA